MKKFIITLLLLGHVFAEPIEPACATADELAKEGADTAYYLRFLSGEDFNKLGKDNAFASSGIETGEYIGYQETTVLGAKIRIGIRSKFTIKKNEGEGFQVWSIDERLPKDDLMNQVFGQNRILTWNQSMFGKGYFMYIANKIVSNDQDIVGITPYYTQFVYDDATYSFSAKPDSINDTDRKYPLGIYEQKNGTEIYRVEDDGAKNTKFCFQKIGSPLECPVEDINIEGLHGEFTTDRCEMDFAEENTVCTVKCADPYVAEGAIATDYTCQRDGTWYFKENIKCRIAPPCATISELKKADETTTYYLRFLSEGDFNKDKKNVFKTAEPESAKYIGYEENSKSFAYLKIGSKIGEASKFNIQVDEDDQGLRVYSRKKTNEQRILSWSQSSGNGYFMYKSNKSTESMDKSDKYTRFHYDVSYSFSARPDNTSNEYQLGIYDQNDFTAIYRQRDLASGAPTTRFCFENVDTPTKCPVQDINIKALNAEFATSGCETASVEEHKVCTAKCADLYVAKGPDTVDYTCQYDGTWKYEKDIECETKPNEKEEKIADMLVTEMGKWFETYRKLNDQQRKPAKSAIMEKLANVDLDQIKNEIIEGALERFFNEEMKSEIKDGDVAVALADDYLEIPTQKGSNVVQFGVLGAVMCLLARN